MASEDLIVTLGLQDKGVSKQITAINKELRFLDREFKNANKTSKEYEKGTDSLQKKLGILEKKYDANKLKLNAYKQKITETNTALNKKKDELDKLTNSENVNEKAVEKCSNQIKKMEETLRNTEREINLTEQELQDLTQEINATNRAIKTKPIEDFQKKMDELGKTLEDKGAKIQAFGQGMNSLGNKMMAISAPILAFGAYATKAAADFEDGMAKVQAISGATGSELEQLKDKAKEMGIKTKFSASQSAEALSYMAMAGWKTNQMLGGLEGIMDLAAASGEDLALVSDIVTDALTAFSMKAEESGKFADILAAASSNANTNVAMMGETFKYVAPVAGSLGYSAEDTAVAIGLMANAGIKASMSGTSLRQILLGLGDGVELNLGKMGKYRVETLKTDGTMRDLNDIIVDLRSGFSKMTEAQKASNAESIAGKVGMSGLLAIVNAAEGDFQKLTAAVNNAEGTSKKMAETMNATAKGQLTLLQSKLEGLGIQIGEKILPHINDFIDKLGELIDWFASLDEGTQQAILKFGLFTAVGGGALKMVGSLTSGIGSLVSGVGKMIPGLARSKAVTEGLGSAASNAAGIKGVGSLIKGFKLLSPAGLAVTAGLAATGMAMKVSKTHTDNLNKSVTTANEDLTWLERTVAKFTGTQFKSRKELEDSNLVYKELSDTMSKEFKTAIEDGTKKLNEFAFFMSEINVDKVITKEEGEEFKNRVTSMCDGAIANIKAKSEETQTAMKELFNSDGILSNEEKVTLQALQRITASSVSKIEERKKEIFAIEQKAQNEKRELREEELKEIQRHLDEIKRLELEQIGSSKEEQLYAEKDFASRVKSITVEAATELLTEKKKAIDEERIAIEAGYDTRIEILESKLGEMDFKEREAAKKTIEDLKKDKEDKLQINRDTWQGFLDIIQEKNPQVMEMINQYNGEELTKADVKKQELLKKWSEQYEGLNQITESGLYRIFNKNRQAYEDISVIVDETSGDIIGVYSTQQNKMAGYTELMAEDARKLGKEHQSATSVIMEALNKSGKASMDNAGTIRSSSGQVVASLKSVKVNADKTADAIIDLNGEEVHIKTNSNGVIQQLKDVKKGVQDIPNKKEITIWERVKRIFTGGDEGSSNKNGRSIPNGSLAENSGFTLADTASNFKLPTIRELPETFNNMITEPRFYSRTNPALATASIQKTITPGSSNIDYSKLAAIIGQAVAQAIANVTIENNFKAEFDGQELTTKISNQLARNVKGRR